MSHITDFHVGYEFAHLRFQLHQSEVELYCRSVGESNPISSQHRLVPQTALAAYALRGILREINLPPGAIHTAQDTSLLRPIKSDEAITFHARLTRNSLRSGWRIVSVDFSGLDEDGNLVIRGRSTVVIPEESGVASNL